MSNSNELILRGPISLPKNRPPIRQTIDITPHRKLGESIESYRSRRRDYAKAIKRRLAR